MSEKSKQILSRIKQLFNAAEPTGLEFKISDTLTIKCDKMEVGGKVTGATFPGEFTLEDKRKVTCDANGLITGIAPAPPQMFMEYKTTDGKVIKCNALTVGEAATIDGKPAAAGEYELEDKTKLSVDASGLIAAVTPPSAETMPDMTTPEGMRKAYDKFANGTMDAAGMSTVLKALMEYAFGWQLREVAEKQTRDAALKVYQDSLSTAQGQIATQEAKMAKQEQILKEMFALVQEFAEIPNADGPAAGSTKKKFSFANTEGRAKSFEKFREAAKELQRRASEEMKVA